MGRWQAPEPANQAAYVEFTEYGLWVASDGCNRITGTWQIAPADYDDASVGAINAPGVFASTLGASTLRACSSADPVNVPEFVGRDTGIFITDAESIALIAESDAGADAVDFMRLVRADS